MTKKCEKIQSIKVNSDIGSYLSVMQTIRHPLLEDEVSDDDSENISIIVGTVSGDIEVFKLDCHF
jgi:hypothetical protein